MNKLTIIGNLTKDPELRHTQDGTAVCGFTVAVNRKKTKNNQEPGADYFNITAWRALGENCAKFLTKGSKVAVVGQISLRTWDNGEKHGANLEVSAEDVEFLSSRNAEPAQNMASTPVSQGQMQIVETDELPF